MLWFEVLGLMVWKLPFGFPFKAPVPPLLFTDVAAAPEAPVAIIRWKGLLVPDEDRGI